MADQGSGPRPTHPTLRAAALMAAVLFAIVALAYLSASS